MKQLKFLGTGSAFNTKLGNTSAYLMNNDKSAILLFDCGETVFSKLKPILEKNKNISEFTICITHSHSDHIGSLPTLLYYLYYMYKDECKCNKNINVHIITHPNNYDIIKSNIGSDFLDEIKSDLDEPSSFKNNIGFEVLFNNIHRTKFILDLDQDKNNIINGFENLSLCYKINMSHVDKTYPLYFYIMDKNNRKYNIYTGDTNQFPPALDNNNYNECERIYIDCCETGNPVHIGVDNIKKDLDNIVSKPEIICMHFDSDNAITKAEEYGFKIARRR
jgi:ribonuclease BN (tRNA processing enzyme)